MHMEHVAAGINARDACFQLIRNHGTARNRRKLHMRSTAQFVFRNQANGEKQCIAIEMHFSSGNRTPVRADFRNRDAGQTIASFNAGHRMGQIQRNVIVMQALHNVSVQTGGEGHQFHAGQDLGALERHAAGHDQADITAAQNHNTFTGHKAFQVDELLGCTGCINPGAARTRRAQRSTGALTTAHGQDHSLCLNYLKAFGGADAGNMLVFGD